MSQNSTDIPKIFTAKATARAITSEKFSKLYDKCLKKLATGNFPIEIQIEEHQTDDMELICGKLQEAGYECKMYSNGFIITNPLIPQPKPHISLRFHSKILKVEVKLVNVKLTRHQMALIHSDFNHYGACYMELISDNIILIEYFDEWRFDQAKRNSNKLLGRLYWNIGIIY